METFLVDIGQRVPLSVQATDAQHAGFMATLAIYNRGLVQPKTLTVMGDEGVVRLEASPIASAASAIAPKREPVKVAAAGWPGTCAASARRRLYPMDWMTLIVGFVAGALVVALLVKKTFAQSDYEVSWRDEAARTQRPGISGAADPIGPADAVWMY